MSGNICTEQVSMMGAGSSTTSVRDEIMEVVYDSESRPVYQGFAAPGTLTSASGWKIVKFEYDGSGNFLRKRYADGSAAYDNIMDDAASYSYS